MPKTASISQTVSLNVYFLTVMEPGNETTVHVAREGSERRRDSSPPARSREQDENQRSNRTKKRKGYSGPTIQHGSRNKGKDLGRGEYL